MSAVPQGFATEAASRRAEWESELGSTESHTGDVAIQGFIETTNV